MEQQPQIGTLQQAGCAACPNQWGIGCKNTIYIYIVYSIYVYTGWTWMDLDGSFLLITGWPVIATACSTNCCRGFCPWIHDAGRPLSFCIRMGQRYPKVTFYCPRHVQHETLRIVRGAAATSPAPGTKCRADACCGVRSWLSPQSFRGSHMCR